MKRILLFLLALILFTSCSDSTKIGEKYNEDELESLSYVFTQNIVEEKTGLKISDDYDNYNIATQKFNDEYNTYIITYSDENNRRIKYIFEWDEIKPEKNFNKEDWYLLVNGEVIFDNLDTKRDEAMNKG